MNEQSVSVAIATYNGEEYLEEQLVSILHQTRPVQEIVISDDGSKDNTLAVARRVADSPEADEVRFVFLQDNPRKGAGGNFEWALTHCSGEILFVCGQDDVWLNNKVESVLQVYTDHLDAQCVVHNFSVINSDSALTGEKFGSETVKTKIIKDYPDNSVIKIDSELLGVAVSEPIITGTTLSIKRELLNKSLPFPTYMEDQWIEFNAILDDRAYFLNTVLVHYRKHANSTTGTGSGIRRRIPRLIRGIKQSKYRQNYYLYEYEFGRLCVQKCIQCDLQNSPAYKTACSVAEIGKYKYDALKCGGISGALRIISLYHQVLRYRRKGFGAFIYDLLFVIQN